MKKSLLKKLKSLGYPLFETEESFDANETLAEVVESKDLRLWEGFPVLLANSLEKGLFDYRQADGHLKNPFDRASLVSLVTMSVALYRLLNLRFSWAEKFYKSLSVAAKKEFNYFFKKLKKSDNLDVNGRAMSGQRLKTTFDNYFSQSKTKLDDLLSAKKDFSLEYAMSQVFSPKQKELFLKKLRGEKMTKTEKEYYSRSVKKKVLALANLEFHNLAMSLAKE